MSERKRSDFKDIVHTTLAALSTAGLVVSAKLATLDSKELGNLLDRVSNNPLIHNYVVGAGELALSPDRGLGIVIGSLGIALVENLRSLEFFKNVPHDLSEKKIEIINSLFTNPAERGSKRFDIKKAIGGYAFAFFPGSTLGVFASLPWLISGDSDTASKVIWNTASTFGSFVGYYTARKFGYRDNNFPTQL